MRRGSTLTATWEQLRQNTVTRVVEDVFVRLGFRTTQRKLDKRSPTSAPSSVPG